MAFTAAMAAINAGAALGNTVIGALRSPAKDETQEALAYQSLANAQRQQQQTALVQALINQRSVAGQTDAFGGGIHYDPGTNTWVTDTGALPKNAQTAAMQAAVSRNTTDLRQAQSANEQAALRAARGGAAADAAQRNLAQFRPMGSDQLVGLLQAQGTNASNATFRPLVQDTLRQFARTGTSAGPVLGQIGKDAASNLRDTLIDAQIKGMTGVDQINQSRRQGLESNAANTAGLATPQFQYSQISPSGVDNTMAQVVAQRAQTGAVGPAYGLAAGNAAAKNTSDAYNTAGASLADPNFGLNSIGGALKNINTATGPGGAVNDLIKAMQGNSSNPVGSSDYNRALSALSGTPESYQQAFGADRTTYVP